MIDPRTNQLFITDIPSKLEELRQLIAKVDVPSRQVLIEARIVEANDTVSRNLGAKLGLHKGPQTSMATGGTVANRVAKAGTVSLGVQTRLSYPLPGPGGPVVGESRIAFSACRPPASMGLTRRSIGDHPVQIGFSKFISLELSALEADGKGKVVSSPRVVTADQHKALIEQGKELPYQVATSSGATSIQFRKANLKLEVTPQITPEGNVILDVDITKDSVGRATTAGFAINTKHVKTQVLVENGGTVVMGGIFQLTDNNTITKVPLLGDIPVLGYLFKTTGKVEQQDRTADLHHAEDHQRRGDHALKELREPCECFARNAAFGRHFWATLLSQFRTRINA